MFPLCVEYRHWQDGPETDRPLSHDDAIILDATWHLDQVTKIEKCSPVLIKAPVFRNLMWLSKLNEEVLGVG